MNKPKFIQLDFDLFVDLFVYATRHGDEDDLQYKRIAAGVRKKIEAMMRHELYSLYKSGSNEEVRAKARAEYLDTIGLFDSYKWTDSQDANISHKPYDCDSPSSE